MLVVTHVSGFPKFFRRHPVYPQIGDVFPSLTSVRHPVGDVAHDKSTVGAASRSRSARWHAQPRLVQGRQRVSLADAAGGIPRYGITRDAAAITFVYRLYGER